MIHCIAIDDEPLALKVIEHYVSKTPFLDLKMSFTDVFLALDYLNKNSVDLLFLDINMPNLNGIELLKSLTSLPITIFTTAYPQYAVQGFELKALDYLVKPFSYQRFLQAVNRIEEVKHEEKSKEAEYLFIKIDKKLVKVFYSDIRYIEAYGDYIKIYTKEIMLLSKMKLSAAMNELPEDKFFQIHRKYIIQKEAIEYIEGNTLKVGVAKLPISNSFKENVFAKICKK